MLYRLGLWLGLGKLSYQTGGPGGLPPGLGSVVTGASVVAGPAVVATNKYVVFWVFSRYMV